uniref:Sema domain-containing protein n=1 Tax=Macrostomum lignano TaxID=282301 RepID=A0A1I8JP53_9PLAT
RPACVTCQHGGLRQRPLPNATGVRQGSMPAPLLRGTLVTSCSSARRAAVEPHLAPAHRAGTARCSLDGLPPVLQQQRGTCVTWIIDCGTGAAVCVGAISGTGDVLPCTLLGSRVLRSADNCNDGLVDCNDPTAATSRCSSVGRSRAAAPAPTHSRCCCPRALSALPHCYQKESRSAYLSEESGFRTGSNFFQLHLLFAFPFITRLARPSLRFEVPGGLISLCWLPHPSSANDDPPQLHLGGHWHAGVPRLHAGSGLQSLDGQNALIGNTLSRPDGSFYLVVVGGRSLSLNIARVMASGQTLTREIRLHVPANSFLHMGLHPAQHGRLLAPAALPTSAVPTPPPPACARQLDSASAQPRCRHNYALLQPRLLFGAELPDSNPCREMAESTRPLCSSSGAPFEFGRAIGLPDGHADAVDGREVPPGLAEVVCYVSVGGSMLRRRFEAGPNLTYHFEWDRLDAFSRPFTDWWRRKTAINLRLFSLFLPIASIRWLQIHRLLTGGFGSTGQFWCPAWSWRQHNSDSGAWTACTPTTITKLGSGTATPERTWKRTAALCQWAGRRAPPRRRGHRVYLSQRPWTSSTVAGTGARRDPLTCPIPADSSSSPQPPASGASSRRLALAAAPDGSLIIGDGRYLRILQWLSGSDSDSEAGGRRSDQLKTLAELPTGFENCDLPSGLRSHGSLAVYISDPTSRQPGWCCSAARRGQGGSSWPAAASPAMPTTPTTAATVDRRPRHGCPRRKVSPLIAAALCTSPTAPHSPTRAPPPPTLPWEDGAIVETVAGHRRGGFAANDEPPLPCGRCDDCVYFIEDRSVLRLTADGFAHIVGRRRRTAPPRWRRRDSQRPLARDDILRRPRAIAFSALGELLIAETVDNGDGGSQRFCQGAPQPDGRLHRLTATSRLQAASTLAVSPLGEVFLADPALAGQQDVYELRGRLQSTAASRCSRLTGSELFTFSKDGKALEHVGPLTGLSLFNFSHSYDNRLTSPVQGRSSPAKAASSWRAATPTARQAAAAAAPAGRGWATPLRTAEFGTTTGDGAWRQAGVAQDKSVRGCLTGFETRPARVWRFDYQRSGPAWRRYGRAGRDVGAPAETTYLTDELGERGSQEAALRAERGRPDCSWRSMAWRAIEAPLNN